jgi:hypothetical protein
MASSSKKVILRTVDDTLHAGYLPLSGFVAERNGQRTVDLFDLEGRIVAIPLASVKSVAYVRDFNLNDRADPERLARRTFLARPRTEGLWVRLTLLDGDPLEGLTPLDLALVDSLLDDRGLFLIPPDIRSNTQRLYIPRSAITSILLLAVITTPSKVKPRTPSDEPQDLLFPDPPKS